MKSTVVQSEAIVLKLSYRPLPFLVYTNSNKDVVLITKLHARMFEGIVVGYRGSPGEWKFEAKPVTISRDVIDEHYFPFNGTVTLKND